MPKYKYVVRDTAGKASSGVLDAKDHDELRRLLRVNDLYLTRAKVAGPSELDQTTVVQSSAFARAAKPRDVVVLIRQLSTLLRAGIPFDEGLRTLMEQIDKPQLHKVLSDLHAGVSEGQSLSECLRRHPKVFNDMTIAMVEAGESTGLLDEALEISALHMDREEELKSRVKSAMVYPKIVVLAAIGTVALMLLLVVPTFKQVYSSLHAELPAMTLALIAISNFCTSYWWAIFLAVGVGWFGFRKYKATPAGERHVDTWMLKVPVVGPLLRKIAIAKFTQTLASGLRGGVPVLQSLSLSAKTSGNVVIRDAVMSTTSGVRDGEPIGKQLEKTAQFPPMVTRMISAGETSGQIDRMLDEVNRYYDQDVQYSIDRMTKMIEPAVTVVVGGIVLFVLLALYMPVFQLGKAFRNAH